LENEFEKVSSDKPQPTRFLRSQQMQAAKLIEEETANEGKFYN